MPTKQTDIWELFSIKKRITMETSLMKHTTSIMPSLLLVFNQQMILVKATSHRTCPECHRYVGEAITARGCWNLTCRGHRHSMRSKEDTASDLNVWPSTR